MVCHIVIRMTDLFSFETASFIFYDICLAKKLLWEKEIRKQKKEKSSKALSVNQDPPVKKRSPAINLPRRKKVNEYRTRNRRTRNIEALHHSTFPCSLFDILMVTISQSSNCHLPQEYIECDRVSGLVFPARIR